MPSVFGCIPPGSRYGNVPNELVHRAGPPFLDNHYRGYQYSNTILYQDPAQSGKYCLQLNCAEIENLKVNCVTGTYQASPFS